MSRAYSPEEMREMALVEESYGWDVVAKMLRQSADILEKIQRVRPRYVTIYRSGTFDHTRTYDGRECEAVVSDIQDMFQEGRKNELL